MYTPDVTGGARRGGLVAYRSTPPGTMQPCDHCHRPIRADEVEFQPALTSPGTAPLRLHQWCFAIWQRTCGES